MLTFWDTVRGCELADTLIRELPKLTTKRKQFSVTLRTVEDNIFVENYITDGKHYVGSYVNSQGQTVVVLER